VTSAVFSRSGSGNDEPEQLNDAQRLRRAADRLDAAVGEIEYVASGELDDSLNNYTRQAWAGALFERVRRLDALVTLLDKSGYAACVSGQDGKRYPRHPGRIDGEVIRSLRDTGLSMRAIADKLGCSVGTVHRLCSTVQA
jgi:hypothetical protein